MAAEGPHAQALHEDPDGDLLLAQLYDMLSGDGPGTAAQAPLEGQASSETDASAGTATDFSMTDASYASDVPACATVESATPDGGGGGGLASANASCSSLSGGSTSTANPGRKWIPAQYIQDYNSRSVTFSKRKDGVTKKATQISAMTGCNVLLVIQQVPTDKPVKTYVYASQTWRTAFFGDAMYAMISMPHGARASPEYIPCEPYEEGVFGGREADGRQTRNEYTYLSDKRSTSTDFYCTVGTGRASQSAATLSEYMPRYNRMRRAQQAEEEYSEDEEDIERSYLENCVANEALAKRREKREYSTTKLVPDLGQRMTCFAKRRGGLLKKAFELVALTNCHVFVAVSSPLVHRPELPPCYYVYASPSWRAGAHFRHLLVTLDEAVKVDYYRAQMLAEGAPPSAEQLWTQAGEAYMALLGNQDEFEPAAQAARELDDYLIPVRALRPSTKNKRKKPSMCLTFPWHVPIPEEVLALVAAAKKRRRARTAAASEATALSEDGGGVSATAATPSPAPRQKKPRVKRPAPSASLPPAQNQPMHHFLLVEAASDSDAPCPPVVVAATEAPPPARRPSIPFRASSDDVLTLGAPQYAAQRPQPHQFQPVILAHSQSGSSDRWNAAAAAAAAQHHQRTPPAALIPKSTSEEPHPFDGASEVGGEDAGVLSAYSDNDVRKLSDIIARLVNTQRNRASLVSPAVTSSALTPAVTVLPPPPPLVASSDSSITKRMQRNRAYKSSESSSAFMLM